MLLCKLRSRFFNLLLLGIFCTFLFNPNIHAQQNGIIEAVDVQGNRRLSDEEMLQYIKTRPGQQFDEKLLQDDLQSLLKTGLFDPPSIRVVTVAGVRDSVNVIFEVRELSLIDKIKFVGLRYATEEELLAVLRKENAEITVNSPFQPVKVRKARQIIAEYLKSRGFFDATVYITEEIYSATTVTVAFVIDELPNDDEDINL